MKFEEIESGEYFQVNDNECEFVYQKILLYKGKNCVNGNGILGFMRDSEWVCLVEPKFKPIYLFKDVSLGNVFLYDGKRYQKYNECNMMDIEAGKLFEASNDMRVAIIPFSEL